MSPSSATAYVLDSFAVLAYLAREPGGDTVQELLYLAEQGLAQCSLSLINWGEAVYLIERRLGLNAARRAIAILESLPITLLPVMQEQVLAAAHLKATYRLSYADAFAVAAAQELDAIIITGDPEFAAVEDIVTVRWLPKPAG